MNNTLGKLISEKKKKLRKFSRAAKTSLNAAIYEDTWHPLVKKKSIGRSEFFASFGGLLGLVAGMSLLSIIEVILLMLVPVFQAVKAYRNRNKVWEFNFHSETNLINRDVVVNKFSHFITKFIDKSSIHGLHNISDKKRSVFEKGFWVFFASMSMVFCLVMIHDVTKRSELNPIEFGIDEKIWNLNEVRFESFLLSYK